MTDELKHFFESEGIEYYAVLPYSAVREINPALAARSGVMPGSVIIFLLPYYTAEADNLSVYSASRDYHIVIREVTGRLIARLSELFPDSTSRGFGDHSPIDEIDAALTARLGILGDSGLLINERYGTYVFVADVLTDIPPEVLGASEPKAHLTCEHCGACAAACPTGILRGESEECLSAITQRKGELTDEEVSLMRECNTVWGCDVCQRVCPHNADPLQTPLAFFHEGRLQRLTSEILDAMSDEEFKQRAFAWRGRKTVERNLKLLDM